MVVVLIVQVYTVCLGVWLVDVQVRGGLSAFVGHNNDHRTKNCLLVVILIVHVYAVCTIKMLRTEHKQ